MKKHYEERDHVAQGNYYIAHVDAMTKEGLHSKSAIAGELAHRDIEIDRLRARVAELEGAVMREHGKWILACKKERDDHLELAAKNSGRESDFAFGSVNTAERLLDACAPGFQKVAG